MPESRLTPEEQDHLPVTDERREIALQRADAWLERLRPLFRDDGPLDVADVKASLGLLRELRGVGPEIQKTVSFDAARRIGLSEGLVRLDQLERRLRERLTELDPSDPDALAVGQEEIARVAEARSRREGEARLRRLAVTPLEIVLSKPDLAGARAVGGFALFWNLFTLVHASILLTAFFKAFGPAALVGLLFYSIFFGVGFAVGKAALDALKSESLRLDGDLLVLTSTIGPFKHVKNIVLADNARFQLVKPKVAGKNLPAREFAVLSANGQTVRFGGRVFEHEKEGLVKRLNERQAARRIQSGRD